MTQTCPLIYIGSDTPDVAEALKLGAIAAGAKQGLKLGLEFFNAQGPQGVAKVREAYPDLSLFLDMKYHDIPNTVEAAVREISKLGIDYLNVHASGGTEMMKRALNGSREGALKTGVNAPKLLGVTILTSLDADDLQMIGYAGGPVEQVTRMARLTQEAGLAGVVCSSQEIEALRRVLGPDFVLMVPGIRPAGSDADDQKRVMTPAQALSIGATHLVIGRPVTQAANQQQALEKILGDLS